MSSIIADNKGIALLLVLWVLTILMVIVFSFSFATRTDVISTIAFKEGVERKYIAEAGIERAILEIFYRRQHMAEEDVWRIDGREYEDRLGDGFYKVRILDESGKININTTSDIILRNLLLNIGVSDEEADVIVDSIMDWKDEDDFYRLNGAESEYYNSLPVPYKPKNAPFDVVEELLMVRGITPEILYGSNEKKGLINFITLYSKTNAININVAPKEVLSALPGISPEIADAIISYRQDKEIRDIGEVGEIIGAGFQLASPYMSSGDSELFTVDSIGYKDKSKGGYGIRATISISGGRIKILYYKRPMQI